MSTQHLSKLSLYSAQLAIVRRVVQSLVLIMGDLVAFFIAALFANAYTPQQDGSVHFGLMDVFQRQEMIAYGVLVMAWLLWFGLVKQVYTRRKPFWSELWLLVTGIVVFMFASAAAVGLLGNHLDLHWFFRAWLLLILLLVIARQVSRWLLICLKLWSIPAVIIGYGNNAKEAYLALQSESGMGFFVEAFVGLQGSDHRRVVEHIKSPVAAIPVVVLDGLSNNVGQLQGYQCIIAMDANETRQRDAVIRLLNRNHIKDIHVIPSMRGVPLYGMETYNFFSHEVLLIQLRNNSASLLHKACKRVFDVVGSVVLLLLLSPLFAVLTYKVARDGGQPIFGHTRVGRYGKLFQCYKFRSMVVDAQDVLTQLLETDPVAKAEWEQDFKLKNDPRVSRLGEMMRRTSLDELPQLFNVLNGDMSLVGPRPVVPDELARYGDDMDYYLMARPGITGLWQVSGRNDVDYPTRVYLDAWYVKNWSLWSDMAILVKTISVVFQRKGAY